MFMKYISRWLGVSASLLVSSVVAKPAFAYSFGNYTVSNLSAVDQSMVHELVSTVAVGTTHRAYMPASAMGWAIGIDVGVEATGVRLPSDFRTTIGTISQSAASDIPSVVPVPRLNLHKGLPFGLDVGASYISYQDKIKVVGGDLKWTFTDLMKVSPIAGAIRFNYTSETLWYLKAHNFQSDLLFSKNLFFIEPYFGAGLQFWSGHIEVPTGLPSGSGLPSSVSGSDSGTNAHFFAGIPLKMGVFWLTPEADYSTAKIVSFGSKFSFNF
jgi:hypothetical protein